MDTAGRILVSTAIRGYVFHICDEATKVIIFVPLITGLPKLREVCPCLCVSVWSSWVRGIACLCDHT